MSSKPASSKKRPEWKGVPAPKGSFPIVAIGASAGGLEAYSEFFHALPSDTGMAFVLIQHLDPSHESLLTEIISKTTRIPVEEVKSGVTIRPNRVYVIPPNALMALAGGVFKLSPRGKTPGQHLAVNFFMHSLARERKSGAIAIVLSGTGVDGTAGMEDIKAEGGITFAQAPATAKYDGMPRSVAESDMTFHDLEFEIMKGRDSLLPFEREVRDSEGRWHGLSILPYRTQDNKIDGVVLALQDIHAVKSANEQLAMSSAFFHGIIDTVREPLLILDHEQRVIALNESFLRAFEVSLEQTANRMLYELGNGHLTQQSLSFYRESAGPTLVNVEEMIDGVLSIYDKRMEAKRIHLTKRFRSDGTKIRTYPGEIRQVFSTLLLNAMDAVDTGGTIDVRVRKASHWQNPAIPGVRVTISDNGVGISATNLPRVFEPFFTTKGENGTGLGLWVASGIVDRFGGSILTRSSVHPDKHGTCFSIFLPTKS